jgi:hypothetical protein
MHRTPTQTCSEDEIEEHLDSIDHVPAEILPDDSLARSALRLLAAAGRDVYCYASGGATTGRWCVWLGGLADVRPDHEGRVPLAEWVTNWRELLAESEGGSA